VKNCMVLFTFDGPDYGNVCILWGKNGKKGVAARFSWVVSGGFLPYYAIKKAKEFIYLNNLYVCRLVVTGNYAHDEAIHVLDSYTINI